MANQAYRDFLQSKEWGRIRRAAKERAGHKCEICTSTLRLEVHHKTYERFGGNERPDDLQLLCRWCHARIHGKDMDTPRVKRKKIKTSHQCEHLTKKKVQCPTRSALLCADGKYRCHVHHPDLTYQRQLDAKRTERRRVEKPKARKARKPRKPRRPRRETYPTPVMDTRSIIPPNDFRSLTP